MLGLKPHWTGRSAQACPLLLHRVVGSGQGVKHEPKTTAPVQRKVAATFGRMKDTQGGHRPPRRAQFTHSKIMIMYCVPDPGSESGDHLKKEEVVTANWDSPGKCNRGGGQHAGGQVRVSPSWALGAKTAGWLGGMLQGDSSWWEQRDRHKVNP